ncbi:LAME_0G05908g1_1 [Lachancea meyersii CBS 8951]|uniref:LAME_0G05908g1_1 n=1 Tax=Lachancea meyersii CBS 8951 TaxID=1266667 RepID=A0A1G4K7D2_9SACH|nr:LAME_0G05908g1_1 [Lachancea meyersii CBS 8951]
MISALFIYSLRGELLISKDVKSTVQKSMAEIFRIQVINNLDVRSPVLTLGSTTFHYIKSPGNLWIVSVSRSNADSAAIWEFLYKLSSLLQAYGLDSEKNMKEEFMTCFELLDVLLENGVPMESEFSNVASLMSVKPSIAVDAFNSFTEGIANGTDRFIPRSRLLKRKSSTFISQDTLKDQQSKIPWRNNGIKYKKNEVFLNVNESINILVSKDGSILKSYVDGTVEATTHLSGMPVCRFGLNDALSITSPFYEGSPETVNKKAIPKAAAGSVMLEDCKFHQCVQLEKFQTDRTINFVPPDGTFELMKYHVRENLNLPFKVTPIVTVSRSGSIEYRITIKSLFPGKLSAKDVQMRIPVPPETVDCSFSTSNGKCKFVAAESAIIWQFSRYQGLTENSISATALPAKGYLLNFDKWSRPSISLKFEVTMFSNSGLVVRFFDILQKDKNYNLIKWIRYISRSGAYEVRY